ncbi:hypothetical protein LMG27174_07245 [Paraburkholderia rhynchosiae]|uniref:Uncharacterized protein n=1 Tax=Paraburkholderia rhynchosiae TaxID=487049 RepID=A0A6J5CV17_9BURK|nr:hypothetical protein LMG27174_07245 [Paraburkholderia rhynchosiae]
MLATPAKVILLTPLSLTLVVVGILFSMTAGFDAQTVAPAIGLLGTIAGYLLGRKDDSTSQ